MSEKLLLQILDEISSMKGEISSMRGEISLMKEDISSMKGEISSMKGKIASINGEIASINGNIDSMNGEIQLIKSQLDENTQLTKSIVHRQEESDAKLDTMSMELHKAYGEITEHDEKLDFLIASQSKQEKTLATLALRSIEQETELRDLKRVK